jgi:UDP-GlcNAc:undecaprenyl-phosphate GlcNAc-1-phosphate transferase
MFMGDTGSMLLGLLLAAMAITITGQIDPALLQLKLNNSVAGTTHKLVPAYLPLILPISVALLPLADMFMAIVRRTKAGRSPLSADKEHMHHRLLQIGHSPRRAVLIMYFWSALVAFITVLFAVSTQRQPIVYLAIAMTVVGLLMLLSPRLGDHRERLRNAASRANLDRFRSEPSPAPRHRARNGGQPAPAPGEALVPAPAIETDPATPAEPLSAGEPVALDESAPPPLPASGMRQRERTLSG